MVGPRYFYRRETSASGVERVFTVAYVHDQDTGETKYGAAVFRRDRASETFVKAKHRQTAAGRLAKCPVYLNVIADHLSGVEDAIRESIIDFGVSGERIA